MSSFVISKKEYVKAAGFIAGIAEADLNRHEHIIYLWNRKDGRVYTKEDYIKSFTQCYVNNAVSVQNQYGDKTAESDTATYSEYFNVFYKKGQNLWKSYKYNCDKSAFIKAICEFQRFTQCVNYQIEDEKLGFLTMSFLNEITSKLLEIVGDAEDLQSWGTFEI